MKKPLPKIKPEDWIRICHECHKEILKGMIYRTIEGKVVCQFCPGFMGGDLRGKRGRC